MAKTILWVDDDQYFVASYAEMLEDMGIKILRETDASSGLRLSRKTKALSAVSF